MTFAYSHNADPTLHIQSQTAAVFSDEDSELNAELARGRLVRVRYSLSAESSAVDAERERIVRTVRRQSPWQDFRSIDDRPCRERMPLTRDTSMDRCGHRRAIWAGRRLLVWRQRGGS